MLEHLCVVELVDAVAGSDDDIWLMRLLQKIEVLIQCVGGATEPVAVLCGDGRCINIQTALLTTEIPPLRGGKVLVQRSGVVLCQYSYSLNMRVRHIGKGEVDGTEGSGYRHRSDRSLIRKLPHTLVITTC